MKQQSRCTTDSLKVLGDFWTLAIIQELQVSEKRFCELERSLKVVNPTTLTNRLKKLEALRIIKRQEETVDKLSVTYGLTPKGRAALSVIREMADFARRYP